MGLKTLASNEIEIPGLGVYQMHMVANALAAQILYLAGQDNDKDIWLYINSPGGSVTAGMAIYGGTALLVPIIAALVYFHSAASVAPMPVSSPACESSCLASLMAMYAWVGIPSVLPISE